MSYKQLAEAMVEMYDISEPSKRTLYEWVKDGTDAAVEAMQDYPADVGTEWVADEMQVKVGGENLWHWNVMDAKTRYVLASHLSPNRDTRAAVAVMRKAARAAKNPPGDRQERQIGFLPAGGCKAVFPDTEHIQSDGIRAIDKQQSVGAVARARTGNAKRRCADWRTWKAASDTSTVGR